ncbi:MAG: hypothetical protein U9M90_01020 [Patescibacteria group bacterium]|nr:hypothetical protein [Patescibacteria group bacterium]
MITPYFSSYLLLGVLSATLKLSIFCAVIALIVFLITKHKKMDNQSQANQNGNVLPGSNQSDSQSGAQTTLPPKKQQKRYSALSVFMAVILFGVVVMFGERLIFDLNRFLNPVIDDDYTKFMNEQQYSARRSFDLDSPKMPIRSYELSQDIAGGVVSNTQIYYNTTQKGRYMMYKLIIHAAVIIPIFVFSFMLFYFKRKNYQLRPLLISFVFVAFWLMFHLLGETIDFVMNEYRNVAIYVILIILAVVFGSLAYYTQIKQHSKERSKA